MIVKRIVYFGQDATHACDGNCGKAWGLSGRPSMGGRYLADDELGTAPEDPGTYEGAHGKPVGARGPDDINKWCVRECERSWLSPPGHPDAAPELPVFSRRERRAG